MSTNLHLDLLKDEERLSSSPVRLRIVVPITAGSVVLACLLWWFLVGYRVHSQTIMKRGLQSSITSLNQTHAAFLDLQRQAKESASQLQQLRFYERSLIRFGPILTRLPELVPPSVQLTELRIPQPPAPQIDPKQPELGPTNTLEGVSLRLAGRTSGEKGSTHIDLLLASIRKAAHTNLIEKVEIPKGSFRQDVARSNDKADSLLFEVMCTCKPRRFE